MPKFQNLGIEIVGQLGSNLYEIKDSSKRINKGEPFFVTQSQLENMPTPTPTPTPSLVETTTQVINDAKILLPKS